MIPFQNLINEGLEKREHKVPTSWQASKIGYCLRGVWLERKGELPTREIDDRTRRVFQMGNHVEEWITSLLRGRKDIKVEEQVRVESAELDVTGYADLILTYEGERELYELKSQHSKSFWWMEKKGKGPNPHHRMQCWLYLYILGIKRGNLVYCSKDDMSILQYPVLLEDKELANETVNRISLLQQAWEKDIPPPLPPEDSFEAKFCAYHDKCLEWGKSPAEGQ